jgi:Skp family chaperone for outer membrane proteins
MKKLFVSAVFAVSLVGFASAQQASSTTDIPPALPPVITTGSSTVDNQVKTLRKEYEAKIKALQQEYLTKLKALIGERKEARKDAREEKKDDRKDMRASSTATTTAGLPRPPKGPEHTDKPGKVEGTSTEGSNLPQGNAFGFLRRFLGF